MRAIQRFGNRLQRLRTTRGLTQEQLAVKAGLVRVYVTKLEQGEHDPTLTMLVRLAKALRVPVTELLGESMSASRWWQVPLNPVSRQWEKDYSLWATVKERRAWSNHYSPGYCAR